MRRPRLIDQQREQWTDGANAFALSPGVIILYERNTRTADELNRHGYHIVYEDDLLLGRRSWSCGSNKKYVILLGQRALARPRRAEVHDDAAGAGRRELNPTPA